MRHILQQAVNLHVFPILGTTTAPFIPPPPIRLRVIEFMEQQDHLLAEARRYGYIEGDEVWLNSFMNLPARKVGQVKESADASLLYFANRFELFRGKVEDLLQKIE